jgi:hypothetical protein
MHSTNSPTRTHPTAPLTEKGDTPMYDILDIMEEKREKIR